MIPRPQNLTQFFSASRKENRCGHSDKKPWYLSLYPLQVATGHLWLTCGSGGEWRLWGAGYVDQYTARGGQGERQCVLNRPKGRCVAALSSPDHLVLVTLQHLRWVYTSFLTVSDNEGSTFLWWQFKAIKRTRIHCHWKENAIVSLSVVLGAYITINRYSKPFGASSLSWGDRIHWHGLKWRTRNIYLFVRMYPHLLTYLYIHLYIEVSLYLFIHVSIWKLRTHWYGFDWCWENTYLLSMWISIYLFSYRSIPLFTYLCLLLYFSISSPILFTPIFNYLFTD